MSPFFKDSAYSYEEEWRLIRRSSGGPRVHFGGECSLIGWL